MLRTKLRKNERCPIHGGYFCCGRERPSWRNKGQQKEPVVRVEDPHHPRGYRELCNRDALRRRLMFKIKEQNGHCASPERGGCGKPFDDFRGVELDHIEPKGMGGARRDDSLENLQALCATCNREKGSRRI